jgi:hypothetical protein
MAKSNKLKQSSRKVHGPRCPSKAEMNTHMKEYASASTAHGFFYLAEDGRSKLERVFWLFVVVSAILFCYFQTATLYIQWQDNPVMTNLDTVSLPIEDIEFPAVTICPQGSMRDIVESVLFLQFSKYIKNELGTNLTRMERSDASNNAVDGKDFTEGRWQLTYDEMMDYVDAFLKDVYPGAMDKPTKLMHFFASTQSYNPLANDDDFYQFYQSPDDECDPTANKKSLKFLNKKLMNDTCPDGFEIAKDKTCLHVANTQMTYNEASNYCQQEIGAHLLELDSYEALDTINVYQIPGMSFVRMFYSTVKLIAFIISIIFKILMILSLLLL